MLTFSKKTACLLLLLCAPLTGNLLAQRSSPSGSAGDGQTSQVNWEPGLDRSTLTIGDDVYRFVGPSQLPGSQGITGVPGLNKGVFSISWKHDPDKTATENGPLEPMTINFTMEPNPGESLRTFFERAGDAVELLRAEFPPNVGPSVG